MSVYLLLLFLGMLASVSTYYVVKRRYEKSMQEFYAQLVLGDKKGRTPKESDHPLIHEIKVFLQKEVETLDDLQAKIEEHEQTIAHQQEMAEPVDTESHKWIALSQENIARQVAFAEKNNDVSYQILLGIDLILETLAFFSDSTNESSTASQQGREKLEEIKTQLLLVHHSIGNTQESIQKLNEKSKQIEAILSVIISISSQTNLLALNASIEAARAGEHGKGFAVVADEVKKLSVQTQKSSKEIAAIIKEIQETAKQSSLDIDITSKEATVSKEMVADTERIFHEIVGHSKEARDVINDALPATKEMETMVNDFRTVNETFKQYVDEYAENIRKQMS